MKVFVYGTLKQGYGNNRLLDKAKFVENAVIPGFKLYDSGFPVAAPDEFSAVSGEIWDISGDHQERTLFNLDSLEGEGRMYNRQEVGEDTYMYVGHPRFWDFDKMKECPNKQNIYTWSR